MVQFHKTAILIWSLWWLELAAAVPLGSCWLQAIREDCLNHKPSSVSASFFCLPLGISLISCSYTQLSGSQSRTIFHLISTHSQPTFICRGIAKITIWSWNYKIYSGLISRTMIFCWQKHCRNHLWWHVIIGYSHFGGLNPWQKLFYRKLFL